MSASLLAVVQSMPQVEPLPAYRRDPETSSIRSSAPSYVSEAPSYHSTAYVPSAGRAGTGLPPANCAPGFGHLRSVDRHGLTHLNFNINQWSSVYSSPQARHYHNVAARRTNLAMIEEQNLLTALVNQTALPSVIQLAPLPLIETTATPDPSTISQIVPDQTPASTQSLPPTTNSTHDQSPPLQSPTTTIQSPPSHPSHPLEDPDLVGHAAASAARERRLYIARETLARRQNEEREAAALREEARRWDFLLAQMADWEERERGWREFKGKMLMQNAALGAGAAGSNAMGGGRRGSVRRVLFRFWK